ncbi:putative aspartyl-tRNA amidotransferase subunit B [Brevibacillus phage Sundance]|uniref:tRNA amidotransferase n=1 Tax=Brevibacillus phage Sundance TaxID=1691958 RepID=UPI0006BDB46B|nr:tRNA amidotransferase [Brevibacillus phage Sundance]ALA47890.1 putative aspartyl-tRNA amidotransferase subunit B [Brevibacillus phage Sundance]
MKTKLRLQNEMKEAMRSKDKQTLATIRLVIDHIQKKEKDLLRDLTEEEIAQVLQTFKKQIGEEIDAFKKANNHDKVEELLASEKLVEKFLPEQMTRDEILLTVHLAIASIQRDEQPVNKGTVMKTLMLHVKGKADNRLVNEIVTEILK